MRHRVAGFKLTRTSSHRTAMFRNLVTALFTYGQISTTVAKAKAIRPMAEKLITLAKKGDLASRRRAISILRDQIMVKGDADADVARNSYGEVIRGGPTQPRVIKHLFDNIAPKYQDRHGGYTRIVRLTQFKVADASQLAVLQLVGNEEGPNVEGKFSRRREKADRRTEFAAKLRKTAKPEAPAAAAPTA